MLERILFVPDTHAPYHDKKAWKLLMKVFNTLDFDWVVVMGDFGDFYATSQHSKDPRREKNLKKELAIPREMLLEFGSVKNKIFCKGNHENNLERYIEKVSPELHGLVSVESALGLEKWKVIEYKQDYKIGRLYITHDVGYSGVNSTRSSMVAYMDNVTVGHSHRLQYMVEGNAKGIAHIGVSFGWLGDVDHIDYTHRLRARKDWALGFGIGYLDPASGFVYMVPCPIVEYTVLIEGKLYK